MATGQMDKQEIVDALRQLASDGELWETSLNGESFATKLGHSPDQIRLAWVEEGSKYRIYTDDQIEENDSGEKVYVDAFGCEHKVIQVIALW